MWDLLEPLESIAPPPKYTQRSISTLDSLVAAYKSAIADADNMNRCGVEKRETGRCQVPGAQLINMTKLSPKPSALRLPTRGPA